MASWSAQAVARPARVAQPRPRQAPRPRPRPVPRAAPRPRPRTRPRVAGGILWIAGVAALLAGIVALNVLSLSLTSDSGRLTERSESVAQDNTVLRARLAKQLSSRRVESIAASLGLQVPDPREIVYLSPDGDDPAVAARRLESGELGAAPDLATAPTAPTDDLTAP